MSYRFQAKDCQFVPNEKIYLAAQPLAIRGLVSNPYPVPVTPFDNPVPSSDPRGCPNPTTWIGRPSTPSELDVQLLTPGVWNGLNVYSSHRVSGPGI